MIKTRFMRFSFFRYFAFSSFSTSFTITPAFLTAAFNCSRVHPNFPVQIFQFVVFVDVYPFRILRPGFGLIVSHAQKTIRSELPQYYARPWEAGRWRSRIARSFPPPLLNPLHSGAS